MKAYHICPGIVFSEPDLMRFFSMAVCVILIVRVLQIKTTLKIRHIFKNYIHVYWIF